MYAASYPGSLSAKLICTYDTGLTDDIFIDLKSAQVRGYYVCKITESEHKHTS